MFNLILFSQSGGIKLKIKLQLFSSHPLAASLSPFFFGQSLEMKRRFKGDFESCVKYFTECSVSKCVKSTLFMSLGIHV